MRRIGTIDSEAAARSFSDYLLTMGIRAPVRGTDVWVEDEEHLEKAKAELEQFLSAPGDERYRKAADAAGTLRKQQAADEEERRRHYVDVRTRWHLDRIAVPALTATLIAMCFIVAAFTEVGDQLDPYAWPLLFVGTEVQDGELAWKEVSALWTEHQYWRLITPIFLHFGPLHLFFNMWWLFDLGGMIEREKNSLTLGGLVLLTGTFGNIAEYFWSGHALFGGMSGVTYGLFGYLWYVGPRDRNPRLGVEPSTTQMLMVWLVLCMTGIVGNIANAAHVGGLVTGFLLGWLSIKLRRR